MKNNNLLKQIKSTVVGAVLLIFAGVYYFNERDTTDGYNIYLLVTLICFGVIMLFAADRLINALLDGVEALLEAFAARVRGGKDAVNLSTSVSAEASAEKTEEPEDEGEAIQDRAEEPVV